jgi:PAS domain-containing protein
MKKLDSIITSFARFLVNFWYGKYDETRNLLISLLAAGLYFLLSHTIFYTYCKITSSVMFVPPTFIVFGVAVYFFLYSKSVNKKMNFLLEFNEIGKGTKMDFHQFDELTKNLAEREKRLTEKASWLNTLIASVTSGLLAVNEEGKVVICNPAASDFLKYENCEDLHDTPITEIFPDIFPSSTFLRDSFKENNRLDCVLTHGVASDNSRVPLELCLSREIVNGTVFLSVIMKKCVTYGRRDSDCLPQI